MSKVLKINGTILEKSQLEKHLEKIALNHSVVDKIDKKTYPVPNMMENYAVISNVYELLTKHIKQGIVMHPAGEWLLDNFYVIEKTVKMIEKELTIKKYESFLGIANGRYEGFARIYVLASEIVAYTDGKIEKEDLEAYLASYQSKKNLNMDEIWNIGIFLNIAIIENIREVCEKIYWSQNQKYKVENIVERLIDNKPKWEQEYKYEKSEKEVEKEITENTKYPFIEYMSYLLKQYGKEGISYLNVFEEAVEMSGVTVAEVIQKEHFDIAVKKVLMGNYITSIKKVERINFLEIFESINGVEEILKKDPVNVYKNMDSRTKEMYRNEIKQIAKQTKISEIYITKKILELSKRDFDENSKKSHIGYYILGEGKSQLYTELKYKKHRVITNKCKVTVYIAVIKVLTIVISLLSAYLLGRSVSSIVLGVVAFFIFTVPISEVVTQTYQYVLSKIVKSKIIPKMDVLKGIDKKDATVVIIPTILDSREKVKRLMKKMEVYYIANKSKNMYFCLLGDVKQSSQRDEEYDKDVIEEGLERAEKLNEKYKQEDFPIFNFIYRRREWNDKEGMFLGWERKRGMIDQFNKFMLGKNVKFAENTFQRYMKEKELPKIKYVITLDADTDLILNAGLELIGAMAHPLNRPVVDEEKNIVVSGYGVIQPRIGMDIEESYKTTFTKLFAGSGGMDIYSNAISDIYQDNFREGIYTGKGIYDLEVFEKVLGNRIPENSVLSHDLLEGSYLRCGLAVDIVLMEGYPSKYNSYINRLSRWIRGDWQILKWINKKYDLNLLSRYKINENLRRSGFEIAVITSIIYTSILSIMYNKQLECFVLAMLAITAYPYVLEMLNEVFCVRGEEKKQSTFAPKISGIKGSIIRLVISIMQLPYKAYISLIAIIKTIYRLGKKEKLLEWMTSEEAEKQAKQNLVSYINQMYICLIFGVIGISFGIYYINYLAIILSTLWLLAPITMQKISRERKKEVKIDLLNREEKEYVEKIAYSTWKYFEEYLTKENNYLIPDNYQEDRKEKIVNRTSSTNIGLSMLSVISAYDMNFINKEDAVEYISNVLKSIEELSKWNGHLYNWYNTTTKEPLIPRFVSTVDSGNLVGYMYTVKAFLEEVKKDENDKSFIESMCKRIEKLIEQTDFKPLYSEENQLFSIGFDVEENKLLDSYYDLLASEARQASLVAIAKKDISPKQRGALSRTLTTYGNYKGLISWSGTSFEYLMPNINIPQYEGSLMDESNKFAIMNQIEYAKEMNMPWGMSESAFNLKDLNSNYQYKAFGVPWLGLKRGLEDEMVVAPYGVVLAINDVTKEAVINLKEIEKEGAVGKYGFYEAVDFTPERVSKNEKSSVVKTYMAHHQALILLSINNLINNKILAKRFKQNPEISAVAILLQETMPERAIVTKETKEKPEKIKYEDHENYIETNYSKLDNRIIRGIVISNEEYTIAQNQKGIGYSKYKDKYVTRFKKTDDYPEGIFFNIKNVRNKEIISSNYDQNENKQNIYTVSFTPDSIKQEITSAGISAKIKTLIAPNDPVEIRSLEITNNGGEEEVLEVTSHFQPVLSTKEQDYAHLAFNNLFLIYKYDEENKCLIVRRKSRNSQEAQMQIATTLIVDKEQNIDFEYEIDHEKFFGRGNTAIPNMVKTSQTFTKEIGLVTEGVVALKRIIKLKPEEKVTVTLVISAGENEEKIVSNLNKYNKNETVQKAVKLSRARVEAETMYLGIKGKDIQLYQKMLRTH